MRSFVLVWTTLSVFSIFVMCYILFSEETISVVYPEIEPIIDIQEVPSYNSYYDGFKSTFALTYQYERDKAIEAELEAERLRQEQYLSTLKQTDYSDDELWLLAHIIHGEAGSNYCTEDLKLYVGSVVLNRVQSKYFPNTIKEVIYSPGQYSCVTNKSFYGNPSDACWEAATELLENGSRLPQDVVFQAQFVQGPVYIKEQNMYFCSKK